MINIELCCGCSACESVCSHRAIRMNADALGFMYPIVDESLCVDCGLCSKVCPFVREASVLYSIHPLKVFAARHNIIKEVETSRSGAVFIALSDEVLDKSGVVYGAGYTGGFRVVHQRAITREQRDSFKGSKYVQSDLRGIYNKVKNDLKDGRLVLFSGTPCQTAALLNYTPPRLRRNLYVVDVVCHGVASPQVWNDYITYVEKKEGQKIVGVNFRDKQVFGWSGLHRESFTFSDGSKHCYSLTFYQPFLIRKSCHDCPYATMSRPSDITIGDFWGWERVDGTINADDKGVNLVLCNTDKGVSLFNAVSSHLQIIPAEKGQYEQPNLQPPTEEHPLRKPFEEDFTEYGFNYVLHKYWKVSMKERMKWRIKRLIGKA